MKNLNYCGHLIEVIEKKLRLRFKQFLLFESTANNAILASVVHPSFKMKWVLKEKRNYVKELFLMEMRKFKKNDNDKRGSNVENEKQDEFYFMFQDDSSDTSTSETTGDLEALQYLQDKDITLSMLKSYPTVKKIFLKYNTSLQA